MSDTIYQATSLTVRQARHVDLPGIQVVATRTWRATYSGHLPEADIKAFVATHYTLDECARRLGPGFLVAARGTSVLGYAQLGLDAEGRAELYTLYVLPEAQGTGVGWHLWRQALERVRTQGRREMVVWVLATNEVGHRFYQRQGARPIAERVSRFGSVAVTEACYHVALA